RLGFLARRIGRGLEYQLQLLAILDADAVRCTPPPGGFQQLVRSIDIEFPFCVLRDEPLWRIDEISGRYPGAPVDICLHRGAIDEQAKRLPDGRVAEQRMFCFDIRALAV